VKFDVEGNKPATDSFIYTKGRKVVGHVTSAVWSPSAKANIAIASLDMPWGRASDSLYAEVYYNAELRWNRLMARCRLVEGAFYDPPRRRETPARDY
jgi:aminomethyltransferase